MIAITGKRVLAEAFNLLLVLADQRVLISQQSVHLLVVVFSKILLVHKLVLIHFLVLSCLFFLRL